MPIETLSLTRAAENCGLTTEELIDGIADDTLAITLENALPPGRNELQEYVVTQRKASIGPPRQHISTMLALLQESLDGWRWSATYAEQRLSQARQEITALEALAERMTQRLEALVLAAQQQERQEKAVTAGQRKIVLDRPTRTPVS